MKKKTYVKYPKILTVTCVTCGAVIDVQLNEPSKHRKRWYCSEKCEREYLARARCHALGSRRQAGKFTAVEGKYEPLRSKILGERPAACDAPKKRDDEVGAKVARDAELKRGDAEYWAALRRAKGITAAAVS